MDYLEDFIKYRSFLIVYINFIILSAIINISNKNIINFIIILEDYLLIRIAFF